MYVYVCKRVYVCWWVGGWMGVCEYVYVCACVVLYVEVTRTVNMYFVYTWHYKKEEPWTSHDIT